MDWHILATRSSAMGTQIGILVLYHLLHSAPAKEFSVCYQAAE